MYWAAVARIVALVILAADSRSGSSPSPPIGEDEDEDDGPAGPRRLGMQSLSWLIRALIVERYFRSTRRCSLGLDTLRDDSGELPHALLLSVLDSSSEERLRFRLPVWLSDQPMLGPWEGFDEVRVVRLGRL
jgi:hypothetical protein